MRYPLVVHTGLIVCCTFLGTVKKACSEERSSIQPTSLMSAQKVERVQRDSEVKDPVPSPRTFKISIRAIGAEGTLPDETVMTSSEASQVLTLDPRLEDLRAKLNKLPFQSFRLLSTDEEVITLKQRDTIHLSNGQRLCLRPLDFSNDQITMWLKWKASDGMSILDTRLSFALNETMVAGIEGQDDDGVILAINISPEIEE